MMMRVQPRAAVALDWLTCGSQNVHQQTQLFFIILCGFFFVDARCSPLSFHHAVINSTVSCVAPSVSAYNSAPPDLFQTSGSNRRSWTVTNCV